jgi:phosphatidylglycerophosphate synthase
MAAASALVPIAIGHRHGATPGRRAAAGLTAALLVEQRFVVWCLDRYRPGAIPGSPDLADALTLSRGVAAAWLAALCASGVRDRGGIAGRLGWGALLWGETLSDWLDGPLARRRGGTRMGSVLDLEADSWLTLWAALAAVRWGDLPPWYAVTPSLRYLLPFVGSRPVKGAPAQAFPGWDRAVGVAQMAAITAALCPWPLGPVRSQARRAATPVAIAALSCLMAREAAWRRTIRPGNAHPRERRAAGASPMLSDNRQVCTRG